MHYKAKIGISIVVILAILAISLAREHRFDTVGTIVFLFSLVLIVILAVLLSLQEKVSVAWFKFALVYIPVAVVLIAVMPENSGLMGFYASDKEDYAWLLSILFLIVSLILIIRAHRRLKRQEKAGPLTSGG